MRGDRDDGIGVPGGADHAAERETRAPFREGAKGSDLAVIEIHVDAAAARDRDGGELERPRAGLGWQVLVRVVELDVDLVGAVRRGGGSVVDVEPAVHGVLAQEIGSGRHGPEDDSRGCRDPERDLARARVPSGEEQEVVCGSDILGVRGNHQGHRLRRARAERELSVQVVRARIPR